MKRRYVRSVPGRLCTRLFGKPAQRHDSPEGRTRFRGLRLAPFPFPHSCQSPGRVYIIAVAAWGAHIAAVIYCRYLRMAPLIKRKNIRSVTRNSSVFSLSGWISAKMHVEPLLRMLGTSSIRCKWHEYRHHAEGTPGIMPKGRMTALMCPFGTMSCVPLTRPCRVPAFRSHVTHRHDNMMRLFGVACITPKGHRTASRPGQS